MQATEVVSTTCVTTCRERLENEVQFWKTKISEIKDKHFQLLFAKNYSMNNK